MQFRPSAVIRISEENTITEITAEEVNALKSTIVLAQLSPLPDTEGNIKKAEAAVREVCSGQHADMIVFPESYMVRIPGHSDIKKKNDFAQRLDGSFVQAMRKLAKQYGIWMVFGMLEQPERSRLLQEEQEKPSRVFNTTVLLDSSGEIVSVYRKTHLYDAFGVRESDRFLAGDSLFTPVDTPFGKIAVFICYELRFPEIARRMALEGAQIILVPAAWYQGPSKKEQFQMLARTRALENTVFLLACNQCGGGTTGGSLAADPMGRIIADAGEEEQLLTVSVDTGQIAEVRRGLPCLEQRHPELYGAVFGDGTEKYSEKPGEI